MDHSPKRLFCFHVCLNPKPGSKTMQISVKCYAGHRGEETPKSFSFGHGEIEVSQVVDMWLAPDHRYFKVEDKGGSVYILRHDHKDMVWELTFFKSIDSP